MWDSTCSQVPSRVESSALKIWATDGAPGVDTDAKGLATEEIGHLICFQPVWGWFSLVSPATGPIIRHSGDG